MHLGVLPSFFILSISLSFRLSLSEIYSLLFRLIASSKSSCSTEAIEILTFFFFLLNRKPIETSISDETVTLKRKKIRTIVIITIIIALFISKTILDSNFDRISLLRVCATAGVLEI